jgi:hypothetical protein
MHLSRIGRAGFEVEHEKKKVNKVIVWARIKKDGN